MFVKCLIVCVLVAVVRAGPPLVGVRYAAPAYAHHAYAHPSPVYAQPLAQAYAHPSPVYAQPGPLYAQPAYHATQAYAVPQVGVKYAAAPAVLHAAPATPVLAAAPVATAVKVATPVLQHHAPQPYDFGYNLQTDDGGSSFRSETGDELNNKKGSFGYTSPDGLYRQVDYIADAAGFRATIRTNEHGTANQNPASVAVLAEEAPLKVVKTVPVVKAAAVAAPIYAAPTYAAPAVVRTPIYASAAAPALVRAAPVYAQPTVYGRHVAAVAPYARAYY